ncbi:uncharacterized protein LOC111467464 [Cucurbita maxima]|uniref:Uncharacterized protein LOC111467464 n=1 Tax=Cucurbita maxima TaxID=3661 RepID=A0A6J1HX57_CUCMA|nr:uncharacterized protein LOC111467464 [Cucurbita maxima]
MQPKRQPISQKLLNFLKASIFLAKMKKPIFPKLLFLKKSSPAKKFELLQFQFSPSTTPLFRCYRGRRRRLRRGGVYSVLFPCRCIGNFGGEIEGEEGFPAIEGRVSEALDCSELSDEEDSIDRRAELFIEKFYADMEMERLAAI